MEKKEPHYIAGACVNWYSHYEEPYGKWKSLSCVRLFTTPRTIYSPWNSPCQNTGVGSRSLLQIFPTQGSNPGLLHCRRILSQLSYQGSPIWRFLTKPKQLPHDLAISFLGLFMAKTLIWKNTGTPMFIAASFTIAMTRQKPKCPSTHKSIKNMWYLFNGILFCFKKEWNNAIYSNMDGARECHVK